MTGEQAVNVATCLVEQAARTPDSAAIHEPCGREPDGSTRYRSITYGELEAESALLARGLSSVGIGRGVRTVLMVRPGRDFFALAFGLARAGAVPVVVDPGMPRASLKACLAEAAPEAFIGIPVAHAARIALGWGRASIKRTVTVGSWALGSGLTLEQVKSAGRACGQLPLPETGRDELAAILFTSGSTGLPKGAVYTHGNFAAQIEALRQISGVTPGEIDLPTFAPFALFDPALGMTTVLPEMDFSRPASADPERLCEAIRRFSVTNVFCSPALLAVLAEWGVPRGVKLPSIRRVVTAGAPVSPSLVEQVSRMLSPDARIVTPYGATEALPVATVEGREILADPMARTARSGVLVGRPVPGLEVAILPISDQALDHWDERLRLPPGEIGEIAVRGAWVTQAYWGRERETALAKIPAPGEAGAWHRMGDVGHLDSEGRLWCSGRKSHRVALEEGETLFTLPCEAIFDTHPAVRRTALVAARSEASTRPVLCVELRSGVPRAPAVRNSLAQELLALGAKDPRTAKIRTVLFHPKFPVDSRHNAKIGREALAVWAESRLR